MWPVERTLRILLCEGSSTSAREAVTALGMQGHRIDICDPDLHCISRFSRFVDRLHRCPALGTDPIGYVSFVLSLVSRERFDVLLPIHEQGLALAAVRDELARHVAVALPQFKAYERAHDKAAFSGLLKDLGLPQPRTQICTSEQARAVGEFPIVVKSAVGTASRGVWLVSTVAQLERALAELEQDNACAERVLVQEFVEAPTEHAQAVFQHGHLLGMHANRQIARGAGGGDAIKESVSRPQVREHLARIGAALRWHGALSVDYLLRNDEPLYIDCNPRLVEPMSAVLAGNDLLSAVLRVSMGQQSHTMPSSQAGVRTHLALQALLGCAVRTRSRTELAKECRRLALRRGPYAGSREELTPLRWDWPSVIPLWGAAVWLSVNPSAAEDMYRRGWGRHLLTPAGIRSIRETFVGRG